MQYLLDYLDKNTSGKPSSDFEMILSHRLQCSECHHVGYSKEPSSSVSLRIDSVPDFKDDRVTFRNCLKAFSDDSQIEDFNCSHCKKKVLAFKRTRFLRLPNYLTFYVQRFVLENWAPKKLSNSL